MQGNELQLAVKSTEVQNNLLWELGDFELNLSEPQFPHCFNVAVGFNDY